MRKYIYKEIEFISNFYYKKNNKSGKEIHKKITGIQDGLIRHMMNLYLLLKKNNYLIKFYQTQTEFLDSRIKSAQLLSLELQSGLCSYSPAEVEAEVDRIYQGPKIFQDVLLDLRVRDGAYLAVNPKPNPALNLRKLSRQIRNDTDQYNKLRTKLKKHQHDN